MRFERLDLLAYGGFQGRSLDLSAPGLHVVFGANEAGKSTTLRAIVGFLYGFAARLDDAYRFQGRDLRVGARVEGPGGERLELVRCKGTKNTLLDAHDSPVDDLVLARMLQGLSESAYRASFGLDAAALRSGAEALLEGEGHLGEGLFDASLGASGAAHALIKSLRERADAIFRPQAKARPLNEALDGLKQAKARAREAGTTIEAYDKQRDTLRQVEAELQEVRKKRAALVERRDALSRAKAVGPRKAKRDALAREDAELSAERLAPEVITLLRDRAAELKARDVDLRKSRERLAEAETHERMARGRLGEGITRPDPRTESAIQAALVSRARLDAALESAVPEAERLEAALAVAKAGARDAPARSIEPLRRAVAAVQSLADARTLATLRAKVRAGGRDLEQRASALGCADGSIEAIVALPVPAAESLEALASELEACAAAKRSAEQRLAERRESHAKWRAELDAAVGAEEPPQPADVAEARASRDARVAGIADALARGDRAASEGALASLRAEIAAADDLVDRLALEADRAAQIRHLRAELTRADEQITQGTSALAEADAAHASSLARLAQAFAPSGVRVGSLVEMRAWLAAHAELVEAAREHAVSSEELRAHDEDRARVSETLLEELARHGVTPAGGELDLVVGEAEAAIKAHEAATARAAQQASAITDLETTLAAARAKLERLREERAACANTLAEHLEALGEDSEADASRVHEALRQARDLFSAMDVTIAERRTIADRERRQREVLAWLSESIRLPVPPGEPDVAHVLELMDARAARAERAAAVRKELEEVEAELRAVDVVFSPEVEALMADLPALATALELASSELSEIEELLTDTQRRHTSVELGLGQFTAHSEAADAALEMQQQLARVRTLSEEWCRLRLAAELLSREIERYRSENQGPLLSRASELFARLTLGAYAGVRAGFDDKDEAALLCVRPGDDVVGVAALSEGARDQLYLALRVASLERYAEAASPLPLVLDDVFASFDDDRARAGLEVLAELAGRLQVLFFTHHGALAAIAKDLASAGHAVTVHELAPPAAQPGREAQGVQ